MKDVIISIMKLNEANRNIVGDADLRNTHNDDFRYLVDKNCSLKLSVLLEYISDLKEINENQKNNSYNYKLLFSTVMNKYALMHEENMEAHIFLNNNLLST